MGGTRQKSTETPRWSVKKLSLNIKVLYWYSVLKAAVLFAGQQLLAQNQSATKQGYRSEMLSFTIKNNARLILHDTSKGGYKSAAILDPCAYGVRCEL